MNQTFTPHDLVRILAAHFASGGQAGDFSACLAWAEGLGLKAQMIEALEDLDALPFLRAAHAPHQMADSTVFSLPELVGDTAVWQGNCIGQVQRYRKPLFPTEWQARIAYESFIDRFVAYIQKQRKVIVVREDDASLSLFIPIQTEFDVESAWAGFVQQAFSMPELQRTFLLMLNSVDIGDSFHDLDVPIVTRSHALLLAAYFYAFGQYLINDVIGSRARNLEGLQQEQANLQNQLTSGQLSIKEKMTVQKKLERMKTSVRKAQEDLNDKCQKHGPSLQALQEIPGQLSPDQLALIKRHSKRFRWQALRKLAARPDSVQKRLRRIPQLMTAATPYDLPLLLTPTGPRGIARPAGDSSAETCYVCGQELAGGRRLKANKLIIPASSQTLQSRTAQTEPHVCGTCATLSIVSPIKTMGTSITIRLRKADDDGRYLLEDHLRMLALGEMNIVAGRYVMVACTERVGNDSLLDKLGGTQYALWKVASIFPADVFSRYCAETILGNTCLELPARHLAWLSALMEVFGGLRNPRGLEDNEFRALSQAIRYIQKEEVIYALYALAGALMGATGYNIVQASRLEDLRQAHVVWLEKDAEGRSPMNELVQKAQLFRDTAALTGILYAFVRFAEQQFATDDDKKLAVKKILEKVENPRHITYEVGGDTRRQEAVLARRNDTYFVFDEARRFLAEELKVDVAYRQQEANRRWKESTDELLLFTFDDVDKAFTTLFEQRYRTDKDQREFTYQLKLSLYSRFPQYIPGGESR